MTQQKDEEANKGFKERQREITEQRSAEWDLWQKIRDIQGNLVESFTQAGQKIQETGSVVQGTSVWFQKLNEQASALVGTLALLGAPIPGIGPILAAIGGIHAFVGAAKELATHDPMANVPAPPLGPNRVWGGIGPGERLDFPDTRQPRKSP
jgi:hypothetical protein